MFCPFCKAEYRTGIARCSDCGLALVDSIPNKDSDANFMVVLWNGESLRLLETVCAELDKANVPVATPRVETLLRDRADRYHLKHMKTFPFVLGVFKRDFQAAREILEAVAQDFVPPVVLPPANAYPEPFDESAKLAHRAKTEPVPDATANVLQSSDVSAVEFFEASLDGLNVPSRRICREDGSFEVRVRPPDESVARQVLGEIKAGASSGLAAAAREDGLLSDKPPQSYFLAWFLPSVYIFVLLASNFAGSFGKASDQTDFFGLAVLGGGASFVGTVWMVFHAKRYEPR